MRHRFSITFTALTLACVSAFADPIDDALSGRVGNGTLTEAEAAVADLVEDGGDDRARLALGLVRFARAGERLVQSLYSFGAGEPIRDGGMQLLPVLGAMPYNASPATVKLGDLDAVARQWITDLEAAQSALAQVHDPDAKLRVDLSTLRFDINADGRIDRDETAGAIFRNILMAGQPAPEGDSFELALDRADAQWMLAYSDVLSGVGEMFLAHDWREPFERCGHLIFPKTVTPHEYLRGPGPLDLTNSGLDFSDVIALIHLLNLPCDEPAAMGRTRERLLSAIGHSRAMWTHVLAETDDDREWLPSPNQEPAIEGVRITQSHVEMWHELLDEGEALLEGRHLVKFWRGEGNLGINIKRVFTEPTGFDLVLWVQGSGASPYLEEGEFVREGFWTDMEQVYGRNLWGYLFYVN